MTDTDRTAIEELLYRYAWLLDAGEWDALGELFGDDGEWVMPAETHEGHTVRGAAAVTSWINANTRRFSDGTPKTNHVSTNVMIEVADGGGTAHARSYLTCFQNVPPDVPDSPLKPIFCGRYLDDLVKSGGTWRFKRRTILATSVGDLSEHVIGR